jgi:sortase (surface protein transpeptidase)
MFITGNVALAYVGLTLLDARLYQVSAKHSLETQIRDGKTAQGNPVQASGQERDVLGRIDIPRLGVSVAVLQGTNSPNIATRCRAYRRQHFLVNRVTVESQDTGHLTCAT